MGWVKHGDNSYYYRNVRRGHRVKSIYMGAGLEAELAAHQDAEAAEARRALIAEHARHRDLAASIEAAGPQLAELVGALHDASLLLAGYHCTSNRRWKRTRESYLMSFKRRTSLTAGNGADLEKAETRTLATLLRNTLQATEAGVSPTELSDFLALTSRIDRDKPSLDDLFELERALRAHSGIWRAVADLAGKTIDTMLDQMQATLSVRMSLAHAAADLRARIAGPGASPIELAFAEQIAVCWVRLRVFETWLDGAISQGDLTIIRFWDDRVSSAQHRYASALESLARVRRYAAATSQLVQINVAGGQVNVAQAGGPDPAAGPPALPAVEPNRGQD